MSMDLSGFVRKKTKKIIGSKEFTFTELTLGDLGRVRGEIKEERKKVLAERRLRLLADADKIGGIDPMELLKLTDASMTEDEIDIEMEKFEHLTTLVYLSLKVEHEKISLDDVNKIMSLSALEEISEILFPDTDDKKKRTRKKVKS